MPAEISSARLSGMIPSVEDDDLASFVPTHLDQQPGMPVQGHSNQFRGFLSVEEGTPRLMHPMPDVTLVQKSAQYPYSGGEAPLLSSFIPVEPPARTVADMVGVAARSADSNETPRLSSFMPVGHPLDTSFPPVVHPLDTDSHLKDQPFSTNLGSRDLAQLMPTELRASSRDTQSGAGD